MTSATEQTECLNCGAPLSGRFCASCGQRVIPPYPSIREMAGDAWQELSGWDGRFVRTIRALFRRPGALTRDVLEGKRARYVSPVRLYLVASVIYFVLAAASPNVEWRDPDTGQTLRFQIGFWTPGESAEQRAALERVASKSHWLARPLFEEMLHEEDALRRRMLTAAPKVLFALVIAFAGIVALFYRERPHSQHLIFALHLHALIFLALSAWEVTKFSHSFLFAMIAGFAAVVLSAVYALRAFHKVYQSRWPSTLLRVFGIGLVYALLALPALLVTAVLTSFFAQSG